MPRIWGRTYEGSTHIERRHVRQSGESSGVAHHCYYIKGTVWAASQAHPRLAALFARRIAIHQSKLSSLLTQPQASGKCLRIYRLQLPKG